MILYDGLYINTGGGKVLQDYLIENLENSGKEVYYLFDIRVKDSYKSIPENRKVYLKASLCSRIKFYAKNANKFNSILCFASLPPYFKIEAKVATYFHQLLYLSIPSEYRFFAKLKLKLKAFISKLLNKNTDCWVVQSNSVKENLASNFQIALDKIKILPFYPPIISKDTSIREPKKFLYVSEGHVHKNHLRLIEAFSMFYLLKEEGELHLTVSDKNKDLCNKIDDLKKIGIPIVNHGFIDRQKLVHLYQSSKFLIYPSLTESFGLGVLEALENGCTIIGANRPYLHSACVPSIVFDPESIDEMSKAFEIALAGTFEPSKQLLFDEIDGLIALLS